MAREFFYAISYAAMMNLHLKVLYGENDHHKLEAMFKAFAKALDAATPVSYTHLDVYKRQGPRLRA